MVRKRLLFLEADLKPPKAGDSYYELLDPVGDEQMLRAFREKKKRKAIPAKPVIVGARERSNSSFIQTSMLLSGSPAQQVQYISGALAADVEEEDQSDASNITLAKAAQNKLIALARSFRLDVDEIIETYLEREDH